MKLEQGKYCPLIKKDCIGIKCSWFMQIRGMNPNTGQEVNEWGCAVAWMPMLTIENSQQQRSTSAAVESFRNEVVKANETNRQIYINELANNFGIIPANITPITNTNLIEPTGDRNEINDSTN
jgi:hypothetical protein